jgi:Ca2+-binding RTX toxin-like protein
MKLAEVTLSGTTGNDTLTGSYGAEDYVVVDGLDGDDVIFVVGCYTLIVDAGAGNDTLVAALGDDQDREDFLMYGGSGDDLLQVNGASVTTIIDGGLGDDTILLDVMNVAPELFTTITISGGAGNDSVVGKLKVLAGGDFWQTISTGSGDDLISLQLSVNYNVRTEIETGAGNDVVRLSYSLESELPSARWPHLDADLGDGDDVIVAASQSRVRQATT